MRAALVAVVATVSLAVAAPSARAPVRDPRQLPGWRAYDRYCLACHGANGDGRGPAAPYSTGRPRDFTKGTYAWRSTPIGEAPTDDDLRQTILYGAAGTSMHGFDQIISATQVDELVDVVKAFAPGSFAKAGAPVSIGNAPAVNAARGAELWTAQGCDRCHGATGHDFTRVPVKRRGGDARRAVAMSVATGLAGTPMPGYAGSVRDDDLWALADHVLALNARVVLGDRSVLDRASIEADRTTQLVPGTWPGTDPDEARIFGAPIPPQGEPPDSLAPAQASLSSQQCARCHAKQEREWRGSVHAAASTWGLGARELDHAGGASCDRCHTPLAEQQRASSAFDAALRAEGVTCAGCHVRNWVRHGPEKRAGSLLPIAGYPLVELPIYERADLCMACHQLPPRTAVNGKPLLNTYKEWLEGPYMRRGVQCQHCHMPNREHTWRGIHDREAFRQGVKLTATAHRSNGTVTVAATLANIGAGHYLPTTPTPAVWVRIELLDARGATIRGGTATARIGREIAFVDNAWKELSDTRIPPREERVIARGWSGASTAVKARISVEVSPDDFYERMYEKRLAAKLPQPTRDAYTTSLARTQAAHYVAEQLDVAIDSPQ